MTESIDILPEGDALDSLSSKESKRIRVNTSKTWTFADEKFLLETFMPRFFRSEGTDALLKAYHGWYSGFCRRLEHGRFEKEQRSMLLRADELIDICIKQIAKYRKYS